MKEDIKIFLESDLLEKYLIGSTTEEESVKVEHFIDRYPEVNSVYIELQDNLENYMRLYAVKSPEGFKEELIKELPRRHATQKLSWLYIAASFVAIICGAASFVFWIQNNSLSSQNAIVSEEMNALKKEIQLTNIEFNDMKSQFDMLNNPETKKYIIKGNQRAKNLKTIAYINPIEKLSLINVVSLPDLPGEQVYQMWANVNGELVNLGVLKNNLNNKELLAVPFKENASSYNITIEPKGGNEQATVENIVANISFD